MDVLLRTASTLAQGCVEAVQRIEVRSILKLTVHQYSQTVFADSRAVTVAITTRLSQDAETAMGRIAEVGDLYKARAEIRRLISIANIDRVTPLLTERNFVDVMEKHLNGLIDEMTGSGTSRRRLLFSAESAGRVEHDASEIINALASIRQRLTTVTTGEVHDFVEVPTLPITEIQKLRNQVAAYRRRRTAIKDEMAAENLRRSITLPDWVVDVLRKHQIIE